MTTDYHDKFKATITITEELSGIIHLIGTYSTLPNGTNFVAVYNNLVINAVCPSKNTFIFNIPFTSTGNIDFLVQLENGDLFPANITYAFPARINDLPHSFIIGDKTIITRIEDSTSLHAQPLEYEKLCNVVNLYVNTNFNDQYHDDKDIIQQYLTQFHHMSNKRIWLLSDRPNRADDNAEYLFKHSVKIADGIEKYFVIDDKSPDAARLAMAGDVVSHASSQHKLLYLFAEKFISSHLHGRLRDICDRDKYLLYAGLDRCQTLFIQHGIILHDMAFWLKRTSQNLKLLVTTSGYEYNSILEGEYDYDKSVVKLTGMPRYDSLYNNDKRKILFAPTWRGAMSPNDLSATQYCKAINNLLNEKNFIAEAKKFGYELLFKPHPNYAHMASCFLVDDYVQIVSYDVSYQKLFAECSLLITDFSSTAFDFSYLKKPVIYYWFTDNLFRASYFDYNTMGFGKVVDNQDKLVEIAINYMKSGCIMEDEYKLRVDNFFEFFDQNNTQRLYEEIAK